jgi:hypothetical protein
MAQRHVKVMIAECALAETFLMPSPEATIRENPCMKKADAGATAATTYCTYSNVSSKLQIIREKTLSDEITSRRGSKNNRQHRQFHRDDFVGLVGVTTTLVKIISSAVLT